MKLITKILLLFFLYYSSEVFKVYEINQANTMSLTISKLLKLQTKTRTINNIKSAYKNTYKTIFTTNTNTNSKTNTFNYLKIHLKNNLKNNLKNLNFHMQIDNPSSKPTNSTTNHTNVNGIIKPYSNIFNITHKLESCDQIIFFEAEYLPNISSITSSIRNSTNTNNINTKKPEDDNYMLHKKAYFTLSAYYINMFGSKNNSKLLKSLHMENIVDKPLELLGAKNCIVFKSNTNTNTNNSSTNTNNPSINNLSINPSNSHSNSPNTNNPNNFNKHNISICMKTHLQLNQLIQKYKTFLKCRLNSNINMQNYNIDNNNAVLNALTAEKINNIIDENCFKNDFGSSGSGNGNNNSILIRKTVKDPNLDYNKLKELIKAELERNGFNVEENNSNNISSNKGPDLLKSNAFIVNSDLKSKDLGKSINQKINDKKEKNKNMHVPGDKE